MASPCDEVSKLFVQSFHRRLQWLGNPSKRHPETGFWEIADALRLLLFQLLFDGSDHFFRIGCDRGFEALYHVAVAVH